MDENYKAKLQTLSRSGALTEYLAANGATIKGYSADVDSNGTLLQKRPLENISASTYANLVNPCNSAYNSTADCLTITYKRTGNVGMLPVAVSAIDKTNGHSHIKVFSIAFNRNAPGYNTAKATAAMYRLCELEKEWCLETEYRLRQSHAAIYEYKISFQRDEADLLSIDQIKPQPYIELVFSAHHYDDEKSVSIVWENTEAGWLPVVSSIDAVINYGFLVLITQDRKEQAAVRIENNNPLS